MRLPFFFFFFFNDTATTEIYTLSLHDALPISGGLFVPGAAAIWKRADIDAVGGFDAGLGPQDRKSTRLNSSHSQISYAVFCLKKKKCHTRPPQQQRASHARQILHTIIH